jgi:ribosomal protein S12 methylthiotransferase
VPGICLRTTLIVGFPGETEADFEELMEFVRWAKFDRMGAFAYSEEEGTFAAENYEDDVPQEVKVQRLDILMKLQEDISSEVASAKIGSTLRVIIDRTEGEYYIGRTEYDSPEVDPEVLILMSEGELQIGQFYNVRIDSADDFDLYGSVVSA